MLGSPPLGFDLAYSRALRVVQGIYYVPCPSNPARAKSMGRLRDAEKRKKGLRRKALALVNLLQAIDLTGGWYRD
jgi:hypothetical protein